MPAPRVPYLFRRRSPDCRVHKLKLPARRKAAFMDCDCPIWAAGRTATGGIPRQSTGTRDLKTAEAILAALISTDKKKQVDGPTIEECIQKHLASHKHELREKRCNGCGRCEEVCPHAVFLVRNRKAVIVDRESCMECGACRMNCALNAISVESGVGCAAAVVGALVRGDKGSCL